MIIYIFAKSQSDHLHVNPYCLKKGHTLNKKIIYACHELISSPGFTGDSHALKKEQTEF